MEDIRFEILERGRGGLTITYSGQVRSVNLRIHDGERCLAVGTYSLDSLLAALEACAAIGRVSYMRDLDQFRADPVLEELP
jgi:hypothetical protein